jgi:proteic killer suppression protein
LTLLPSRVIIPAMIESFRDRRTAALFEGRLVKGTPADLLARAQNKLLMIDQARSLDDLRAPPSNRLEALRKDRAGQYSIRVSGKWRICFVWRDGNVEQVEFCDYH